jgi:hypothetical protein
VIPHASCLLPTQGQQLIRQLQAGYPFTSVSYCHSASSDIAGGKQLVSRDAESMNV